MAAISLSDQAAPAHPKDVFQQIHGLMLTAGAILDEAGDETIS